MLLRDGFTFRTPWCNAPARHIDHIRAHATGGPTSYVNGQGLCVRCNLVKEALGWIARVTVIDSALEQEPDGTGAVTTGRRDSRATAGRRHAVATTTPTGHTYVSTPPALLPALLTALRPVMAQVPLPTTLPGTSPTSPQPTKPAPSSGVEPVGATSVGATSGAEVHEEVQLEHTAAA